VSFLLVMTSWPFRLSDAVTAALPTKSALMAFIISPTVSVPVEAYVVIPVPALMVIEPPAGIPSVSSEVLVLTDALLVPVAGELGALDELADPAGLEMEDEDDPVEALDDGNAVSPKDCRALCTAAESWELTRFKAVSLAMLARPFDKLLSAEAITLMSESCAEVA
jgi:hypothetical protein